MKKLNDLYQGIGTDIVVRGIKNNIADVSNGDLFVFNIKQIPDYDYFDEAIKKGACAVVTNRSLRDSRIPVITVPDASREYPYLCQKFYDFPDRKMQMIGITGLMERPVLHLYYKVFLVLVWLVILDLMVEVVRLFQILIRKI